MYLGGSCVSALPVAAGSVLACLFYLNLQGVNIILLSAEVFRINRVTQLNWSSGGSLCLVTG